MAAKLQERFLKADAEYPCEGCGKVRKTCRHCEKCKDCCDCPICPHCGGAEMDRSCDEFVKEVGDECYCETCAGWPARGCQGLIDSRDPYGIDDKGVWCNKCGPKHFKE